MLKNQYHNINNNYWKDRHANYIEYIKDLFEGLIDQLLFRQVIVF